MGAKKLKTQEQLNKADKKNVYELVTDMILEKIESGVLPWRKPWNTFTPRNAITNKEYRGINNTILSMFSGESGVFMTFQQAKKDEFTVLKGAKSIPVVFHVFDDLDEPDERGRDRIYKGARYYRVFKIEDTTAKDHLDKYVDIEDVKPLEESKRVERLEKAVGEMVEGLGLKLKFEHNSAYYQPKGHFINMPKFKNFKTVDSYYATFFHELVHATSKDLCRDLKGHFGSKDYSFEELIAELGASFLCSHFQVSNEGEELNQSAAYIKGWSSKFVEDKKMVFKASSFAQIAVDHLINKVEKLPF